MIIGSNRPACEGVGQLKWPRIPPEHVFQVCLICISVQSGIASGDEFGHRVSAYVDVNVRLADVIDRLIQVDRMRIPWQAFPHERTVNPSRRFRTEMAQGETVSNVLDRLLKGSDYLWEFRNGYYLIRPRVSTTEFSYLQRGVSAFTLDDVDAYTAALKLNPPLEEIDSSRVTFKIYRQQPTKARFDINISKSSRRNL